LITLVTPVAQSFNFNYGSINYMTKTPKIKLGFYDSTTTEEEVHSQPQQS